MDAATLAMANLAARRRLAAKRPRIILPFGDSISYMDAGLLSDSPLKDAATAYRHSGAKHTGMYAWANFFLGHPFKFIGNAGVPGDTTAQMLARINAMLSIQSDVVAVQAGANDWTEAGTAGRTGAQQAAITTANLAAIYDRILARGKTLLAVTTHSRSTMNSTDGKVFLSTVNRWIADYARSTPGVLFADTCSAITDPATGVPYNPISGALYPTSDGTHPNGYGAMLQGKRIAAALAPIVSPLPVFSTLGNADPANFSRNACSTGTGGTLANGVTGTVGANMTVGATSGTAVAAASKVARTDGEPGEWQRVVIGPANTVPVFVQTSTLFGGSNVMVGDKVLVAIEVKWSGLTGVTRFEGGVLYSGASVGAFDLAGTWSQVGTTGTIPDGSGVFLVEGYEIPVGATFLNLRVILGAAAGTLDVGRTALFKTT